MADKRMVSRKIVESDAFYDLSHTEQALYFHLQMAADDDGFINNVKSIARGMGADIDDINALIDAGFIILFPSGVVCIKHWKINNTIQKDRYKETTYLEEKAMLTVKDNGAYTTDPSHVSMDTQDEESLDTQIPESLDTQDEDLLDTQIADFLDTQGEGFLDTQEAESLDTQIRLDKIRLDKIRLDKGSCSSSEETTTTTLSNTIPIPPTSDDMYEFIPKAQRICEKYDLDLKFPVEEIEPFIAYNIRQKWRKINDDESMALCMWGWMLNKDKFELEKEGY